MRGKEVRVCSEIILRFVGTLLFVSWTHFVGYVGILGK